MGRIARTAGLIAVSLILVTAGVYAPDPAGAASGPVIVADLGGRPILAVDVGRYHCEDLDFPRIHCYRSAPELAGSDVPRNPPGDELRAGLRQQELHRRLDVPVGPV